MYFIVLDLYCYFIFNCGLCVTTSTQTAQRSSAAEVWSTPISKHSEEVLL